jgi:hypothetical protein
MSYWKPLTSNKVLKSKNMPIKVVEGKGNVGYNNSGHDSALNKYLAIDTVKQSNESSTKTV